MYTLYTIHNGVMGRRVYKTISSLKRAVTNTWRNRTFDSVSNGCFFYTGYTGLKQFMEDYA